MAFGVFGFESGQKLFEHLVWMHGRKLFENFAKTASKSRSTKARYTRRIRNFNLALEHLAVWPMSDHITLRVWDET